MVLYQDQSSSQQLQNGTSLTSTTAPTSNRIVDQVVEFVYTKFVAFLDGFILNDKEKLEVGDLGDSQDDEDEDEDEEMNGKPRLLKKKLIHHYHHRIKRMLDDERSSLSIDFKHLRRYDYTLSSAIESNYHRVDQALRKALLLVAKRVFPDKFLALASQKTEKSYFVCFYNVNENIKIRDLRTSKIGTLCSITGTVTRTSEIRPELLIGSFICMDCNTSSSKVYQQFKYTEPSKCLAPQCNNTRRWSINMEESIFIDWQKVRIQESSNEIPSGSMPRSIDIILRGDAVESARAGDRCQFIGSLMVIPDVSRMNIGQSASIIKGIPNSVGESGKDDFGGVGGLKDLGVREMNYKLCFFATTVRSTDSKSSSNVEQTVNIKSTQIDSLDSDDYETPEQFLEQLTELERNSVIEMSKTKKLYKTLVGSIAPSIFGHEEIKRGVLLMMFGGVHKKTPEKIRLRGDINVCIVGDPSTSKSQFLKYLVSFMPRTVYTSGKASSAAGLTATVVRDPDTGDFNIEAGALMLADNGICCIDEFDKMDPADQVAIHEAMEQQTISIAKAGIHATLNARASILAAANPIGGRYDTSKTLKANLNIGAPLMSRFDLFFIVLDECNAVTDRLIAQHIVSVHQKREKGLSAHFQTKDIQNYIRYARLFNPKITEESAALFESYYSKLRQNDSTGHNKTAYRITVRQLESMIRLSEALARLHLDTEVKTKYVDEAARLLRKSIIHVQSEDIELDNDDNNNNNNNNNSKSDDIPISMSQDIADDNSSLSGSTKSIKQPIKKKKIDHKTTTTSKTDKKKTTTKTKEEPAPTQQLKQKVKLSFEQYMQLTNMLMMYIEKEGNGNGVSQKNIIDWYLKDLLETNELELETMEIHKVKIVLQKMINEKQLLVLEENNPQDKDTRILIVHPNQTSLL